MIWYPYAGFLLQGYGSSLQDHGASPEAVAYNEEQVLPKVLNKSQVHSPVTSPRILLSQSHDEAPASTDAVLRYALWHNHAPSHANNATVHLLLHACIASLAC